ncbi:Clavaminate synthase-like protein [Venustampulla echinocandica]|uniref:Clavaminate synthase-like protein n=1 Tax=Venustampulla echinocandica TaxID=2656787 RepID=A0A370TQ93_9HELO|nr:Clavaminate synthase-like protein [Venustampulla echinocandica]RDL37695.1 Clavaminate synthase-like protein [Venustampulla echinocandica]
MASSTGNIPIVDFSTWTPQSSSEERAAIAKELANACHNVGFVSIINHAIPPALLDEAFGWTKRLFDLTNEEKMLAPHPDGPTVHRGYSWPGLEKVSQVISTDPQVGEKLRAVVDCKESYEVGSEENAEQPNIWLPEPVLPGFREFMTSFYWQCSKASREVLTAIAAGMGLKVPESLLKFHSGHNNQLRLLHYPPIPAAHLESGSHARMPAHSDWGSITLLFQDDCGGLEVENQFVPGEFVKVVPVKHAMVVNVGDLLMRWSNDWLKSTLHRVTAPPADHRFTGPERMIPARYSIPYFVAPDGDTVIECMPECVTESNPVKYEPVTQREYQRLRGNLQY